MSFTSLHDDGFILFQIGGCYLIAGHDILDVDKLPLKVIYHPLYGMNKYVLIWSDRGD